MKKHNLKEYRAIFKLSFPIIISFLSYQILGITDMIMVGRLGAEAVAAVGVAITLFMFISLPIEGLFDSSLILLSKKYGAKDNIGFKKVLFHELALGFIFGILGLLLYPLLKFILGFMSPTEAVFNQGSQYLLVAVIGFVPYIMNWILTKTLISVGANKSLAYIANIAVIVNITLNYILIFGKLGFPALGVIGSAVATVISRGIQMAILAFVCRKVLKEKVKERYKISFDRELVLQIFRLGYPMAQANFIEIAGWTVFVAFISKLGVVALAAHEICMKIKDIAFMPGLAMSNVSTSLTGAAVGAGDYKKARNYCKNVTVVTVVVMGMIGVIIFLFPNVLLGLFTKDKEIMDIGRQLLSLLIIYQVIDAIFIVLRGSLNGIGETRVVRNVIIIGAWFIMIPSAFILINYTNVGVLGAWIGLTLNVLISGIIMAIRFNKKTTEEMNERALLIKEA